MSDFTVTELRAMAAIALSLQPVRGVEHQALILGIARSRQIRGSRPIGCCEKSSCPFQTIERVVKGMPAHRRIAILDHLMSGEALLLRAAPRTEPEAVM